ILPLIAGAALAWLVPRALRPLRALGDAAASRSADTFDPFVADGTAEIQPIVQRLNDLLQRIDHARQRERRFLDDAAHELRTPLAELHLLTDVALLGQDNAHEQAEVFEEIREVTRRMTHLVEALFRMARNRRLPAGVACEEVSLAALMHDVMRTKVGLIQQR
ncbi:MAG: histidine kinase dimerization/phospho-acceptor domain-containing protein, partial [Planctomycetota bacterium]